VEGSGGGTGGADGKSIVALFVGLPGLFGPASFSVLGGADGGSGVGGTVAPLFVGVGCFAWLVSLGGVGGGIGIAGFVIGAEIGGEITLCPGLAGVVRLAVGGVALKVGVMLF
jgi:hypothetical protein